MLTRYNTVTKNTAARGAFLVLIAIAIVAFVVSGCGRCLPRLKI